MKHFLLLTVVGSVLLLTGCAGVGGDFECHATTRDRCMTMEQANQKARQQEKTSKGKQAVARLPDPVNLPLQISGTAPAVLPSHQQMEMLTATVLPSVTASPLLATPRCPAGEKMPAQRTTEKIVHLWIAPWIDTDDALHQPGRISFVVGSAHWQLPQAMD
ncbi:type IV conjugative transfer system lipoprotein TraV [Candidatus Regiella insecticola 5.15]|uniref:Type IV conjugative transfer system lipoprotein TraV n=1 Tax=Candidatus Regiella insecticola 5.15 TaxID=1005043 RepID=G2GX03_9ENTR|nr:type IV conjugative transfer system lipoprotein TraV [Candidatus Regiella insecticola]EGY29727.1 type IV conjugative transfer system lipoprotein TraV [Candidatus Regiella insecticola 5.15]